MILLLLNCINHKNLSKERSLFKALSCKSHIGNVFYIQCLEGLRAESVREELNIWRDNYIDVATTLDEFVALKGRSGLLRDEVS